MDPRNERRLIIILSLALAFLAVTPVCWFYPHQVPSTSPRFALGVGFLMAGAVVAFVASLFQLRWQRQFHRAG
jgi:hypothetical protein